MDLNEVTGHAAVYGVIGDPVAHSLSPVIMNEAFAEAGIDAIYGAFPVPAKELAAVLAECREGAVAGLNVTYPHKEAVAAAADTQSPRVRLLGAANTLAFRAGGAVHAHNTDAPGTARAIEVFGRTACGEARAVIFGAGGAARAAALGLLEAGAREIRFLVRDPAKAEAAIARLRAAYPDTAMRCLSLRERSDGLQQAVHDAGIVVQATPVGMQDVTEDSDQLILPIAGASGVLHEGQVCLEMVYHPRETPFLTAARRANTTALDGLCLLIAQAAESFARWTGERFDPVRMYAHLESYLAEVTGE